MHTAGPQGNIEVLLAEADALMEVSRFDQAVERSKEAVQLAPDDARPFCEWSRALQGLGLFAEAAEVAGNAIRLAPNSPYGFRLRSRALSHLARESPRHERKQIAKPAVTDAKEAVRLSPRDANGFLCLAQAQSLVGNNDDALDAMERATALAPNSVTTWVTDSLVAIGAKNWDKAIKSSRQALAIDPNNFAALNNLGVALRASGRGRQGTEVLAQAARLEPNSKTVRRNISNAGIKIVRICLLLILIPIALVSHIGIALYVLVAVGSNVLLLRFPKAVLRLERWTAPIALKFAKKPREPE